MMIGDVWFFDDTKEPTAEAWKKRPCGYCGMFPTIDGHDGCLETLPGITNACCGHGEEEEAYLQFQDGSVVSGKEAIAWRLALDAAR